MYTVEEGQKQKEVMGKGKGKKGSKEEPTQDSDGCKPHTHSSKNPKLSSQW